MNDFNELVNRFVTMWNETNAALRNQYVRELWVEDGTECTTVRETRSHSALEARVTASHEKNIRDGGCLFRSCNDVNGHHGLIKFNWQMYRVRDGVVQSTGFYVLLVEDSEKILKAWLFVDP